MAGNDAKADLGIGFAGARIMGLLDSSRIGRVIHHRVKRDARIIELHEVRAAGSRGSTRTLASAG